MNYKGLYDVDYKVLLGRPYIFLFIRNEDRTKEIKTINNFYPYLYVDIKDINTIKTNKLLLDKVREIKSETYKTIFRKEVKKVNVNQPFNTAYLREALSQTYEADILFSLRYCIDEVDDIKETEYKILYFDIETDTEHGFSRKEDPIIPIISISGYDNYSKQITTFCWRKDQKERKENNIFFFNNEIDMLKAFLRYWKEQDCDIITAWNLGFDIGYLIARLDELNIIKNNKTNNFNKAEYDCDLGEIIIRPKGEIEIFGKVLFDLLKAYKKMHFGELNSYALNNIAQTELGEEKEKIYNTGDVWRQDLDKLISYNRKDVELIYKIDNNCKLISIFDDIKRFSGVRNINDCFYASRIHETRIMKKFRNLVFPNKPPFQEKSEATMIQGAFVKEPISGIYSNVICIDAKSLYPSIIYTFNLSKEMICDAGSLIRNVRVKQYPKGIMPQMIKELVQLKDDMKTKVAGTGQSLADKMFAIKTFINSFYGVNALTSFRLYDKDIAENITFLGREITQKASEMVEKKFGYKVVYNDTDSLFVELKDNNNRVEIGKQIEEFLDEEINKYCKEKYNVHESTLHMEFEKIYDKIILQRKKRYAGRIVWADGKNKDEIAIAGMAARRSDTPDISKKIQQDLLEMILKNSNKKECLIYITKMIDDIINNRIKKTSIAQPVKLNTPIENYKVQNTPKIRGVKWSNNNINTSFSAGDKFKMIYVEHPDTNVVCFEEDEDIENFKIDWDMQLDKCIFQKIKPIFNTLGWEEDYNKIKSNIDQKLKGQQVLW